MPRESINIDSKWDPSVAIGDLRMTERGKAFRTCPEFISGMIKNIANLHFNKMCYNISESQDSFLDPNVYGLQRNFRAYPKKRR